MACMETALLGSVPALSTDSSLSLCNCAASTSVLGSLQFRFNRVNAFGDPNTFFHEHAMAGYLLWALYEIDKHFFFALWVGGTFHACSCFWFFQDYCAQPSKRHSSAKSPGATELTLMICLTAGRTMFTVSFHAG